MKWFIPAKTFLLGEYSAIAGASAIVLTTTPYFELSLTSKKDLVGIHPKSPAGIWWHQQAINKGLSWYDPYMEQGGLGASSAQFLASYWASCSEQQKQPILSHLLNAYYQISWTGTGLKPSGYDLIAQSQQGCVYINKNNRIIQSYNWPFQDLSFFLIHTGVKLATHRHLQVATLPEQIDYLSSLVDEAKQAFEHTNSQQLIKSVQLYHEQLAELNLVAEHSLKIIQELNQYPEVLTIKGCGALGADILILFSLKNDALALNTKLKAKNYTILANENAITLEKTHFFPMDWL
jgi:mevalonate kinase